MKFENTDVWGFEHAIRGMRNPKNSWALSDSHWAGKSYETPEGIMYAYSKEFIIGPKDMKLMQTLIRSGSEHRKFMRQIMVSVDITAPFYWLPTFPGQHRNGFHGLCEPFPAGAFPGTEHPAGVPFPQRHFLGERRGVCSLLRGYRAGSRSALYPSVPACTQ